MTKGGDEEASCRRRVISEGKSEKGKEGTESTMKDG